MHLTRLRAFLTRLRAAGSQPHSSLSVPSSVLPGAGNLWTTSHKLPCICQCLALTKRLEDRRKGETISLPVPGGASSNGGSSNGRKWPEMSISVVSVAIVAAAVPTCSNPTGKKTREQISDFILLSPRSPASIPHRPKLTGSQRSRESSGAVCTIQFSEHKQRLRLDLEGSVDKTEQSPLYPVCSSSPFLDLCNQFSVLNLPLCEIYNVVSIFLTGQWLVQYSLWI